MSRTLFFLELTGCEACAEAKPHVEAFAASHPDVVVEKIDLADEEWPDAAPVGPPEYTPAYCVVQAGRRPRTIAGRVLTVEELDRWVYARG